MLLMKRKRKNGKKKKTRKTKSAGSVILQSSFGINASEKGIKCSLPLESFSEHQHNSSRFLKSQLQHTSSSLLLMFAVQVSEKVWQVYDVELSILGASTVSCMTLF